MGGVDLMDQLRSAYQLDRGSKFLFYLRLFFDLLDVALVNSFILYKKLENKDLTLKDFKICIALKLIAFFVSRTIVHPSAPNLKDPAWYLHHICQFCWRQNDDVLGKENRTFVTGSLCVVALCLQKERNWFLQYHS